jgi:hypothetical protein
VVEGRLRAFYALQSGTFTLSERDRSEPNIRAVVGAGDGLGLHANQPASHILWLAKDRTARDLEVKTILAHAIHTAKQVAELQGNVALVVDPYENGESLGKRWRAYGFRPAEGVRMRLWLPLQRDLRGLEAAV